MKDLITGLASILLLMVFLLQFVVSQTVYTRIMGTEYAAKQFCIDMEESRETEIKERYVWKLKEGAALAAGCDAAEVSVQVTENEYEMSVPIRNIIGAAELLGITPEENQLIHRTKGIVYIKEKQEETEDEKHDNNDGASDSFQHASEISDGT